MADIPTMDPEDRAELLAELTEHGVAPELVEPTADRLWKVVHIIDETEDWSELPKLLGITGLGGEKVAD